MLSRVPRRKLNGDAAVILILGSKHIHYLSFTVQNKPLLSTLLDILLQLLFQLFNFPLIYLVKLKLDLLLI